MDKTACRLLNKYSSRHRARVRRQLAEAAFPDAIAGVVASYTEDDQLLEQMRTGLIKRLRSGGPIPNFLAAMIEIYSERCAVTVCHRAAGDGGMLYVIERYSITVIKYARGLLREVEACELDKDPRYLDECPPKHSMVTGQILLQFAACGGRFDRLGNLWLFCAPADPSGGLLEGPGAFGEGRRSYFLHEISRDFAPQN
jgi:hypothetical protein